MEQGLLPAIIQDWLDGTVLMLGLYEPRSDSAKTLATKSVHFWSRSRKKFWEKGETSGIQAGQVKELFIDCDRRHDSREGASVSDRPATQASARAFSPKLDEQGGIVQEKNPDAQGGILESVHPHDSRTPFQSPSRVPTQPSCSPAVTIRS
jgi:phosphoribosyl-AMP cyclohydrolase / phosphoribosyl-ATP pyrophosphohydrolase